MSTKKVSMKKRIVFISRVRNPDNDATSTDIMTRNLIYGLREHCEELIFIAIVDELSIKENISDYYGKLVDKIIFIKRFTKLDKGRIGSHLSMMYTCFFKNIKKQRERLDLILNKDTILITHSPAIDSAKLGTELKKYNPDVKYIQYWSDPMALSLIVPSQFNYKRWDLFLIEKYLHRRADKIVYGTESLYKAQKELYKKSNHKMYKCNVSYKPEKLKIDIGDKNAKELTFGYLGNFYSNIRNIKPLYDAFSSMDNIKLIICGMGDISLRQSKNINIYSRLPQSEIVKMEEQEDVIICILNCVGMQIPGKIFYQTNSDKIILVILDGPQKELIRKELECFNRFVFCENNKEEIIQTVRDISEGKYTVNKNKLYELTPQQVCAELITDGIIIKK